MLFLTQRLLVGVVAKHFSAPCRQRDFVYVSSESCEHLNQLFPLTFSNMHTDSNASICLHAGFATYAGRRSATVGPCSTNKMFKGSSD